MNSSYQLTLACFLVGLAVSHGFYSSEEHGTYRGPRGTSCKCGWANKDSTRIVGGVQTKANEYPFMVLLVREVKGNMYPFCGATIITPFHIVTAAHCTHGVTDPIHAVIGEHDFTSVIPSKTSKQVYRVRIMNHEHYDPNMITNDIALLMTSQEIKFNDFVGPACMPTSYPRLVNQRVKVTGWGHEQWKGQVSRVLKKVSLGVIGNERCSPHYPYNPLSTKQFCTYEPGKDSCQGDSGGPVTWVDPETNRYTLVGVVSFGKQCAGPSPGVNTDVFSHKDWLESRIRSTVPGARLCYKV